MIVLLVASLVVLVGLAVALVLLRGERLSVHAAAATSTMSGGLPPGDLTSRDIDEVRFDTVVRGYRMDQVDDVLERVRVELTRREDELRRLRAQAPAGPLRPAGEPGVGRAPLTSVAPPTVWEDDTDDDLAPFDPPDRTGRPDRPGRPGEVGELGERPGVAPWSSRDEAGGPDRPRGAGRDRPGADR